MNFMLQIYFYVMEV